MKCVHSDTVRQASRELLTLGETDAAFHTRLEEAAVAMKEYEQMLRTLVGYVESRPKDGSRPKATAAAARAMLGNLFD